MSSGELDFDAPVASAAERPLTVSELVERVRGSLEERFPGVTVIGEISNLATPASGHAYFNLKDDRCGLRAVLFRGARRHLRFEPENGLTVVARGRVTVYAARGDLQIIVDSLEPEGLGALAKAFEQLKQRLEREGLFDPARKRPLPFLPRRVGIVTSRTGAVLRDIVHVARRRHPSIDLLLAPTRVQGEGAAEEVARALAKLAGSGLVDVIIVARGGGSLEDLWAFNEEVLARAIHACPVPVVSAVGHETDFTIADFVADVRAPTPSAAAEVVVPDRRRLVAEVHDLARGFEGAARRGLASRRTEVERTTPRAASLSRAVMDRRQRIDELVSRAARALVGHLAVVSRDHRNLAHRLVAASPARRIEMTRERLGRTEDRMRGTIRARIAALVSQLDATRGRLEALDPTAVLERGYAVVTLASTGDVLRGPDEVDVGDGLEIRVARGRIAAEVTRAHGPRDGSA